MAVSVGLAVGSSAVRVAVMERSGAGAMKLLRVHEVACETSSAEALTRTLLQIKRTVGITTPVILGLPSTCAILSTLHPLIVNPQHAGAAVAFELQQHLPFALTEAAWHYQWLPQGNGQVPAGRGVASARVQPAVTAVPPQPADAVVAAIKRTLLEERLSSCRRAGVSVQTVTINALALLNTWCAAAAQESRRSFAILHVMDASSAEWIVQAPALFHALPISAEASAFADAVVASWEVLREQSPHLPETVWIVAPPALALQCEEIVRTRLQLQPSRLDWSQLIKGDTARLEAQEQMGTAIGLALQGLGSVRLPLNLLAAAKRLEQSRQLYQMATLTGGACALIALGLGVSTMFDVRRRHADVLQLIERRERVYQTLRPDIRALLQQQQHLEQRTQQLEQLVHDAPLLGRALSEVAQALPDGVWLGKADYSKNEQVEGLLEGRAKSFQEVTQLLDQLKSVAKMAMVKPLSTNVTTDPVSGKDVVVFSIQVQRPLRATERAQTEHTQ